MTNEQINIESLRALIKIAKEMGYTQPQISEVMGVTKVTLINTMQGKHKTRNLIKMRDSLKEFLLSQVHLKKKEHIEAMDKIERDIRAWDIEVLKNSLDIK